MIDCSYRLFVGFAAEDRHTIAEPLIYHLKNYGVNTWYDRHNLLLGDERRKMNLEEGVSESAYSCIIISEHTSSSNCAMEEFSIIKERVMHGEMIVFPILYEMPLTELSNELQWIKKYIFKEVDKHSGTREICNHIACKISADMSKSYPYKHISDIISAPSAFTPATIEILRSYQKIDSANLNSRISLLYAAYLSTIHSTAHTVILSKNPQMILVHRIFERLFSETQLSLSVDYRELWLLENAMCLLANYSLDTNTESNI